MLKMFKVFYFTFLFGLFSVPLNLASMATGPVDDIAFAVFAEAHPEIADDDLLPAYLLSIQPPVQAAVPVQIPVPFVAMDDVPELSVEDRAAIDEVVHQLPEIMRDAQQVIDQGKHDLEDLRRDMAAKSLSDAIFEIPVGDNFLVGVYKKDLARFGFQLCDYALDKFLHNQMQLYYQQKALSGLKDKLPALIATLDTCEQSGLLNVLKDPLLGEAFALKCVNVLDINIKFNLKWFLHLTFNFVCKNYLSEVENSWMGYHPLNFGYAATSLGSLINKFGSVANVAMKQAAVNGGAMPALNAKIKHMVDEFKNKKIRMSIYPLVNFLVFGHLPIELKAENSFKAVVFLIKALDFYWFNSRHIQKIDLLNSKKFILAAKFFGQYLFLRHSCVQYQFFLRYYIKKNIHMFIKILNDAKIASHSGQESYADAEKKLKDFIKGSEVEFKYWKLQKSFDRNQVFVTIGVLTTYAVYGTLLYLLWRKS